MAIAILGATSAIGREIALVLERQGQDLLKFARTPDQSMKRLDVLDFDDGIFRADLQSKGRLDGVILCVGYLGDNVRAFSDPQEHARIMDTNYTGSARALDAASEVMQGGYICALSSVAGDRPRRKVFTYGTAKAALNDHLERMRRKLAPKGIRVVTVKLGSVDTRMVTHRRRHPFVLSAQEAAEQIVQAAGSRLNGTVYLPGKWKIIMAAMKMVPEGIYQRL
jgi:decaprenylphospho-beta-D-erythro-pentofuranosid-2-ulose 2-reductase